MCITQFSLIGATFIAIFLTGQYSTTDLAGVATGYNLWLLFYIFAQGTLLGITPIISQLLGAKKTDDISMIFHQGLFIGTGLAFIILLILSAKDESCVMIINFVFDALLNMD